MVKNFFHVIRPFKINFLSNFQTCNTVLLTIVTTLYITSPWLIYFLTRSLYLLIPFIHFANSSPSTSGNHQPVLCICDFCFLCLFCFCLFVCLFSYIHNQTNWIFYNFLSSFPSLPSLHCISLASALITPPWSLLPTSSLTSKHLTGVSQSSS